MNLANPMRSSFLFLFICFAAVSVAHGQNVLIDGNFDTSTPNTIGTVSGWDVTGNVAAVGNQGFTSSSLAAALSVGDNTENDMLSQTFTTTIGQTYTLDFDAGVYGKPTAGALSLQIQITGTTSLFDTTVQPPNNNDFNPAPFDHYSYMFTADSASTTLTFTDHGLGNASADVMVDTVSVAPIPEPGSVGLLLLGAGWLGLAGLRKRG